MIALLGRALAPLWLNPGRLLAMLHEDPTQARQRYAALLHNASKPEAREIPDTHFCDEPGAGQAGLAAA
jgi:hypothetical protein